MSSAFQVYGLLMKISRIFAILLIKFVLYLLTSGASCYSGCEPPAKVLSNPETVELSGTLAKVMELNK